MASRSSSDGTPELIALLETARLDVRSELPRADAKANMLLALLVAVLALEGAVAVQGKLAPAAMLAFAPGALCVLIAVVALLGVIRPYPSKAAGWRLFIDRAPREILDLAAAKGREMWQINDACEMARIVRRKYWLIRVGVDLTYAGLALQLAALVVTLTLL
ncbi:hypothetical protein HII36_48460 [Nonomuraea sp. NN258]|uniref:Pycsar system effector family protein n=1 Tax=Nonomuraea antri TaxID=2730852 RepID=UPI001568FE83|nr:Pycsar system effector family protein [Nonomuraea antri]NRQ39613.1 hypothetical protein [Nonomuraea antri]